MTDAARKPRSRSGPAGAAAPSGGGERSSLRGEPFTFPVRVYYEDTDAAGVVYYANYLRYMERARTEWLAAQGFPLAELEAEFGIVFVVTRAEIDFRSSARLGDRLDVGVDPVERGRARLVVQQDARRGEDLVASARVTLGCLDRKTWRPTRMPAPLLEKLA
jgi:acyl-CoA thioester hydrolase